MSFSNRDGIIPPPICCSSLRSQSGQGTIEYVLVLVVGVAIILGMLFQLNDAFKTWANNYFGDYLACLLETGELPTIGGSPGDSGVCEQLFKPFNMAEGRKRKDAGGNKSAEEKPSSGTGTSERATAAGGSPVRYPSSGSGFLGKNGSGVPTRTGKKLGGNSSGTGNTSATGYGEGSSFYRRSSTQQPKARLDNKFAFEKDQDRQRRRNLASAVKKPEDYSRNGAIRLKAKDLKKVKAEVASSEFSLGNFIRYIVIICIVLALLFFLGGQALQISKSMD